MLSKIRDCRLIKCTTVLHGGVCHRTSTPHKSGNKVKKKKLRKYDKDLFPTWVWPGGATRNGSLLDIKMDTIAVRRGHPAGTAATQGNGNHSVDVAK